MIDCIDKQQHRQQQGREQSFWAPASNHLHRASSNLAPSQAPSQTKPSHQILVDVQPDEPQVQQPHQQANNELIGYYFGSISRETAEWILLNHGQQLDGAYLLRSSGPKDDFVLSLLVVHGLDSQPARNAAYSTPSLAANSALATKQNGLAQTLEVLHYKIVETEDSFVALHGQVGDEKFATIDELIERAQGVATKPKWPIQRHALETQILPPTFWGLTVDQIRLAILIKAKQWGFPLSIFQQPAQNGYESQSSLLAGEVNGGTPASSIGGGPLDQQQSVNTLNNETIRTLIYKSLHEFQPWFHGRIGRDEAERRIEENCQRDGRFLVRERDNFSYAMCISHKRTTKHYRIDVLSTGELAIQDGRKFTSLMALVSHYTIMSDGLWCALTEACPRPIQQQLVMSTLLKQAAHIQAGQKRLAALETSQRNCAKGQGIYCTAPAATQADEVRRDRQKSSPSSGTSPMCPNQSATVLSIKAPIKEWLLTINNKWSQMLAGSRQSNGQPSQSLNSFLFGSSNPLNNHCRHKNHSHHHHHHHNQRRNSKARQTNPSQASHKSNRQHKANTIARQLSDGSCQCCPPIERALVSQQNQSVHAQALKPTASMSSNLVAGQCQTKALLSSLPQGPGFMLDGQSFIGSPLFAVRPLQSNGLNGVNFGRSICQPTQIALSDASNGYRFGSTNGNGTNNVEKLISPAQSITNGLDHAGLNQVTPEDGQMSNPYALNTDFYGSQTSTAIVNDQLRTNSSSSSSSHHRRANQPHQLKRAGLLPSAQQNSHRPQQASDTMKYGAYNQQPPIRMGAEQVQNVAGQIVCGQHAGPAYRYTNCTGNQANLELSQCAHSRRSLNVGWSQHQARAADDLQLLGATSGSQLVGPAALTKFVQFQDGQCLRTHRDTKSIQMAYLLSRQEALNVLNDRHQAATSRRLKPVAPGGNQVQRQQPPVGMTSWQDNPTARLDAMIRPAANQINQQAESNAIEYDLIDCDGDGSGFQFKYDPKLIKSSSIETLCGFGDERGDDFESHNVDLDAFKSNSELLMSLNPLWSTGAPTTTGGELYPDRNPLAPTSAGLPNGARVSNGGDCLSSLLQLGGSCIVDGREELREPNTVATDNQLDESWNKKHNLDELTTSLLAELTASLKAQVDLKNKRSGLCSMEANEQIGEIQSEHERKSQSRRRVEANPMDLIEEFDTLIRDKR